MKKFIALFLSLVMLCTLTIPALAEEPVTPTPPDGYPEELYLVFPGDPVYQPEYWSQITALRDKAVKGEEIDFKYMKGGMELENSPNSVGEAYELALICLRAAVTEKNAGRTSPYGVYGIALCEACGHFEHAAKRWEKQCGEKDDIYWNLRLWASRTIVFSGSGWNEDNLLNMLKERGMTVEDYFDIPYSDWYTQEQWTKYYKQLSAYSKSVLVYLDGERLYGDLSDALPGIRSGRTMVPIRGVAEALGTDVGWNGSTQQVTLTRGGDTIVMTVGSRTATVNGKPMTMSVAPYISNGRTMIPVRYVAEFFGQKVTWDEQKRLVEITEDKSVVGDSNVEMWTLALGLIRVGPTAPWLHPNYVSGFGLVRTAKQRTTCRGYLSREWGISSHDELVALIQRMTYNGHNASFQYNAAILKSLSDEQYAALYAQYGENGKYNLELTKLLMQQWGDKGILAWDLSRMANLCAWGYGAGYLTFEEALRLAQPVAQLASENFTSWQEFYENYLGGRLWWSGEVLTDKNGAFVFDIWQSERGPACRSMLKGATDKRILDNTLFETGVIPLPDAE